jgi:hypothetical protein
MPQAAKQIHPTVHQKHIISVEASSEGQKFVEAEVANHSDKAHKIIKGPGIF